MSMQDMLGLTRAHVPQANSIIVTTARKQRSIGIEHDATYSIGVSSQNLKAFLSTHIPQDDCAIITTTGEKLAVWIERQ